MTRINDQMPSKHKVPWEWEDRICTCDDPKKHVVDDILGFVCSVCLKTFRYNLYLCQDCGQSYLNISFSSEYKCNGHLRCYTCLTGQPEFTKCEHPMCRSIFDNKPSWVKEEYLYPRERRSSEAVESDLDDFFKVDLTFSVDSVDFD